MSLARSPVSTWASWPLLVGIAIPIAGIALLCVLGAVSYLQHSRREWGPRLDNLPCYKDHDFERFSESSKSSTSQYLTPTIPKPSSAKPSRPTKLRDHTAECALTISKKRLTTIQEYKHSSMEWKFPMPPTAAPGVSEGHIRPLSHTRDHFEVAWLSNQQSFSDQNIMPWCADRTENSWHPHDFARFSYAKPNPTAADNFELDILQPTVTLRQEEAQDHRTQDKHHGYGLADVHQTSRLRFEDFSS